MRKLSLDDLSNYCSTLADFVKDVEVSEDFAEKYKLRFPGVHYRPIEKDEILRLSLINAGNVAFLLKLDENRQTGKIGKQAKELLKQHLFAEELNKFLLTSIEFASVIIAAKENNLNPDFSEMKEILSFCDLDLAEKQAKEIEEKIKKDKEVKGAKK